MSCNDSKCKAWLCILRSEALDALDNSSNRSSTFTAPCYQRSLLASPSSCLQDYLSNSEPSVAPGNGTKWPLHCSIHHDPNTTQSLRKQLGVDATSESFAWTSALETPSKSVRPQNPSLQDRTRGASVLDLHSNNSGIEKPCDVTQNNGNCQDLHNGEHCPARVSEQRCDQVRLDQVENLCAQVVSRDSNEEEFPHKCSLPYRNSFTSSAVTDIRSMNKSNLVHEEKECNLQLTSDNHAARDFHNGCSYILDSVSPKLRRRTRTNTLDKKVLARSLFKHESGTPPDCARPVLGPAVAESGGESTIRHNEEADVDVRMAADTNSTDMPAYRSSVPCSNADKSELNDLSGVPRKEDNGHSVGALVKESDFDEVSKKFYELKKSPTIASRTPVNRLRTLPFKTSTPLLGTALFSALGSHGKENLYKIDGSTRISVDGKHEDLPAVNSDRTSCGDILRRGDKGEYSRETGDRKVEDQISAPGAFISSTAKDETNPIDLLCSPVKRVNEQASCDRLNSVGLVSSPVLSTNKYNISDRSKEKEFLPAAETEIKLSESKSSINVNERRVFSPDFLHQNDASITSVAFHSNNDCLDTTQCSLAVDSTDKTAPLHSSDNKTILNDLCTPSIQTTLQPEPRTSTNESPQLTSCATRSGSCLDVPATSSASLVLSSSKSSRVATPSASCATLTSIPVCNPIIDSSSSTVPAAGHSSPVSTPVTHRKPRRLCLSARGAQKLEMLKKKINSNSNFIYPSPLMQQSNRARALQNSPSIHREISSCSFIDADITTVVPPVGKASMKCERETASTSPLLEPAEELSNTISLEAGSKQGNVREQNEACTKQVSTSALECTLTTSSIRPESLGTSDGCPARSNMAPNCSRKTLDHVRIIHKSPAQNELFHQTVSTESIPSRNYMNSEELAEVDDILQNCDFDFDDMAHTVGDEGTKYKASNKLRTSGNVTSSDVNSSVPQTSQSFDDGKRLSDRPAFDSFVFQTGRGAAVQVSKEAVARASRLWKETTDNEAFVPRPKIASETDSFAVPSIDEKLIHKNNSESTLPSHRAEIARTNSCSVNKGAVVPEIDSKIGETLPGNGKSFDNINVCAPGEGSVNASVCFSGFKTAAGNDLKVNEEAMNKALRLWGECGDLKNATGNAKDASSFSGFLTAGGAKVETNSLALAKAKHRLDKLDLTVEAISEKSSGVQEVGLGMAANGFLTASGKPTSASAEAIKKAKRIWSDCDVPGGMPTAIDRAASGGFSSAKGCRLPLSHDSLLKAQRLWDECAQSDAVGSSSAATSENNFGGFKTASGTQVSVSGKAIQAAKSLLNDMEEPDSEHILLSSRKKEEIISKPYPKTSTDRPPKKGFIRHKIDLKKISGLSSGLPEPDSYSKIQSDLSRRIYPQTKFSEKPSCTGGLNDASAPKPVTVNLSAEEKAILDSQFQDITEEFLNDDWNIEPEVSSKPHTVNSDFLNNEVSDVTKGLAVQGEKRKILFENEKHSKRWKAPSSSLRDGDAEYSNASVPQLWENASVGNACSQKSLASVEVQCSRRCDEEVQSSSRLAGFTEKRPFSSAIVSDDGRAPTTNTAKSAVSGSEILPTCLDNSYAVSNNDSLRDTRRSSLEGTKQQLVSKNSSSSTSELGCRNIANDSSENANLGSHSKSIVSEPSANSVLKSESAISLQVSSSSKLSLNSVPDSETLISDNIIYPILKTDSPNNCTSTSTSNFQKSSISDASCNETERLSADEPNRARPDNSPILARSRQIKKKIQYLRDVYRTPTALSPLPTSPAVLRMPFRAPLKKKA